MYHIAKQEYPTPKADDLDGVLLFSDTKIHKYMKTPISYFGGKQTMLKHILPLIPSHTIYTEAFCGGCAVFFAKPPVAAEVINDLNSEMINFYEMAKLQPVALEMIISSTLHSRTQHGRAILINRSPESHSPIERAWAV